MTDSSPPSTAVLHDTIRDLFPHGNFSIDFRRLDTRIVIVTRCYCGRKLDMLDSLDGTILLYWLLDHDDDIFLTPEQLHAKYEATIKPLPEGSRPLLYDPDTALHNGDPA